jgi:hypothetical protein
LQPSHTAEGWEYNETELRLFRDNECAPDCHKITNNDHKTSNSNYTEEIKYEKLKIGSIRLCWIRNRSTAKLFDKAKDKAIPVTWRGGP